MKAAFIIFVVTLVLMYCCGSLDEASPAESFIPGTYVRFSQHEYGKEYDTIIITRHKQWTEEYNILRKWKYERVLDGRPIEPEYKTIRTSGVYNTKHKLLHETETGSIMSFDVAAKLLFIGPSKYKKL